MAHHNTVFSQLLKLVPRHEFETLANQHQAGRKLRKISRRSQFVTLGLAQLSGRNSLRDLVSNLAAQMTKRYHLGVAKVARFPLARVNESQPCSLYEALFAKLAVRCQALAPRHGFRFKNTLYSLDVSTIDLCLSVFPWAKLRTIKGAVKLHVGLDHDRFLPAFVAITDDKTDDIIAAWLLALPKGSIVAFDRGYTDYAWYHQLHANCVYFVTRQRKNARYRVTERREIDRAKGLSCYQTILLIGTKAGNWLIALRRISFRDAETGQRYIFLTNNFQLAAATIAAIYKSRWQIELIFQMDESEPENQGFSKYLEKCRADPALDRGLRLSAARLSQIHQSSWQQLSTDTASASAQFIDRRDLRALLRGDPPLSKVSPLQATL